MMAVISFCLRLPPAGDLLPAALADSKGRVRKHAAIWQLGSYIWVPPPENPQGLAQLYVRTQMLCKEKSAEVVDFPRDCGNVPFQFGPKPPGTPNTVRRNPKLCSLRPPRFPPDLVRSPSSLLPFFLTLRSLCLCVKFSFCFPKNPAPRNPPSAPAAQFPTPTPPDSHAPAKSNTHRPHSG